MESTFCRLCAEQKPLKKLLHLQKHQAKYVDICRKLEYLQAVFVNMSDDTFPIAICSVCYDSLNHAYKFLERVQKAQSVLSKKLTKRKKDHSVNSDVSTREDTEDSCDGNIFKSEQIEVPVDIEYFSESLPNTTGRKKKQYTPIVNIVQPIRTDLHWSNIPWLCYFCDSQFSTMEDLRTHAKTKHNTCGAFKCSYCNLKIPKNNFKNFIRHLKKHVKCLRHWCHYCNEPFPTFSKLVAHLPIHIEGRGLCLYCGETFDDENCLQNHLVRYSARQENPKPRRKPGEPEDIADRTCKICNKILLNASSIPAHIQHMHADRQPKYTCELCGKTFYWRESVTAHVQTVHEKSRSFQCKICNKTFTQRSNLKMHVTALHSEEKLYECEVCGKKCSRKTQLTEHKKTHTDDLPFNCEFCNKAFRTKPYLKNHLRQHTGEKPHACEFCGKTFTCTGNRNKHLLRIHNKDTPKRVKPSQYVPSAELEEWKQELTKRTFTRDVAAEIPRNDESTINEFTGQCW